MRALGAAQPGKPEQRHDRVGTAVLGNHQPLHGGAAHGPAQLVCPATVNRPSRAPVPLTWGKRRRREWRSHCHARNQS